MLKRPGSSTPVRPGYRPTGSSYRRSGGGGFRIGGFGGGFGSIGSDDDGSNPTITTTIFDNTGGGNQPDPVTVDTTSNQPSGFDDQST